MIAYAEARSDLVSGELTADELVDATLLRAYREFVKDPARGEIKRWLIQLAADELAGKIKQSRWERKHTVYVEERVPETPQAEEVSTLGEETLYFYQPDEALKVEDVIPDLTVPSPEEETERKELRQCVREALATMSREWRRALLLRYVNGLTGTKLAKAIGTTESEVERVIEYAREYLRHSLIQSGCSFQTT
jgi:RNA polymerase sigma factor (sigma-70 family)